MQHFAGPVRFISDLHLQPGFDPVNQRFTRFLGDCARERVEALFILGDLFEYWVGDDALADPFNTDISAQLRALSDHGTAVFFQHGNRDFLVGARMAEASGMQLLPERAQVCVGGTAILLMHGDALCTDDGEYQAFRSLVRAPTWQAAFLARPLADRLAEVARLREHSRQASLAKSAQIMDANTEAIVSELSASGCLYLIHGHTHRPGISRHDIGARHAERWVLSDWTERRGDALEFSAGTLRRLAWDH